MGERGLPQLTQEASLGLFKNGLVLFETNLLKYPFSLLSKNNLKKLLQEAAKTQKSHIACEVQMPDGSRRIWQVNPNITTGYTHPFDKQVLVTVLKLVTDEGFPPPILWRLGSLSRICRTMKISDKGVNPRSVKESLLRISATNIYTETFWLKDKKEYWCERPERIGGSFTPWSVLWKGDKLLDGQVADSIYLTFNVPFLLSLQAFYVSPLDYDYWLSLPPLAQRIYELTGRKFYGLADSDYARYEYGELCQLLPIQPQRKFSDAQRILDRGHKVLKKTAWLEGSRWEGERRRGKLIPNEPWAIRYYPGPRAEAEIAEAEKRLARFQQWKERQLISLDAESVVQLHSLVQEMERATGDTHSRGAFTKIAKGLPQQVIWRFLSEIKADHLHGPLGVKRSPSAILMDKVRRYCQDRKLDIGIKFKAN